MVRTPFIGVLVLLLVAFHIVPIGHLRAQVPGTGGHEHLTGVACVDVPPGEKRPEFGCFNIGMVDRAPFQRSIRLLAFAHVSQQEGGRGGEERDRNCGGGRRASVALRIRSPKHSAARWGGHRRRRPTAASRGNQLHRGSLLRCHAAGGQFEGASHPGPEGWYVLAGEQCLDTPDGANRARAGGTMTVRPNIPMELDVTGTTLRRAFALVIHDSAQERGIPSDWKPSGACSR